MGEKEGDIIYIYYDRWRERERKLNINKINIYHTSYDMIRRMIRSMHMIF